VSDDEAVARDEERRSRAVVVMAWFVLPWSPLVALGMWALGEPLPALAVALVSVGCLGAVALARRATTLAVHVLVFGLWQGLWVGGLLLGGVGSPPTQWLVLIPVMATAGGGIRAGFQWTAALVTGALLMHAAQLAGWVPSHYLYLFDGWEILGTFTAIGSYLLMAGFLWANDTRYRRLLDRVSAAETAEREANRAKSVFLANMSHELRTPLNAVLGYTELVADEAEARGHGDLVDDLQKANRAGRHLLALLNDVLDLSKVEAGRLELVLEDVELAPLVAELAEELAPLVAANRNTLEVRVLPHRVRADRVRLQQCVRNLLSNAVKFTSDGTIRVSAEGGRLEVTDSGIGMTAEQLGRAFEPFVQGDVTIAHRFGGTGLGLTIVKRLIEQMGGVVGLESRAGEGTRAWMQLPVR
jgi:signal transduction histidine kinase